MGSLAVDRSVLPLTSNGRRVSHDPADLGELQAGNALIDDPDGLRERFFSDGYVLLRDLLDPAPIRELRARYLHAVACSGRRRSHGMAGHPAHELVRTAEFRDFVANRSLSDVAACLLGGSAGVLPRCILRDYQPGSRRASRAHRDRAYITPGRFGIVTAWIPLGDCPVGGGGLVYLEDSQEADDTPLAAAPVTDRPDDRRPLSHDLAHVAQTLGRRWLTAHYRAGDVVFHSPDVIHASLDVATSEPRVSVDVRFARRDDDIDPRWSAAWSGDDGY